MHQIESTAFTHTNAPIYSHEGCFIICTQSYKNIGVSMCMCACMQRIRSLKIYKQAAPFALCKYLWLDKLATAAAATSPQILNKLICLRVCVCMYRCICSGRLSVYSLLAAVACIARGGDVGKKFSAIILPAKELHRVSVWLCVDIHIYMSMYVIPALCEYIYTYVSMHMIQRPLKCI